MGGYLAYVLDQHHQRAGRDRAGRRHGVEYLDA
jgi:hypothetical protein